MRRVPAVADDLAAVDDHVAARRRRSPRTRPPRPRVSDSVPARRTPSRPTVTRSARAPGAIRPASGQPRQACPSSVAARSRAAAVWQAALAAREALVELDRARLLEEVDHGVGVAAERKRCAGVRPAGASGRSRRPGRARWSGRRSSRPGAAEQRHVGVGQVRGVHGGEARASAPASSSTRRRGAPVGLQAGAVLGRLLGDVRVQRAVSLARPRPRRRRPRPGRPRARCGSPRRSAPTLVVLRARRRAPPRPRASASEKRRWGSLGGSPMPPCR